MIESLSGVQGYGKQTFDGHENGLIMYVDGLEMMILYLQPM